MQDAVLSGRGLQKTFIRGSEQITPVDSVDIDVARGEFTCIYGASGCGKSTLLRCLAGLIAVDAGEVRVDGTAISHTKPREAARVRLEKIGVVFQDNNLIDMLNARENIALPLAARGLDKAAVDAEVNRCMDLLGIGELGDSQLSTLSGGQVQRVGIARALAGKRPVLLADEPTGALDERNSIMLFTTLRELAEAGQGVLMVTHDPLAREFAHRELRMRDGKVVA